MSRLILTAVYVCCLLAASLGQAALALEWHTELVDAGERSGYGTSMALDSQGNVRVAYVDYEHQLLKYACRVNGTWVTQTVGSLTRYSDSAPTLILDQDDNPTISYLNSAGYVSLATLSGTQWNTQSFGAPSWSAVFTAAMDPTGNTHLMTVGYDNQGLKHIVWNGETSTTETVDAGVMGGTDVALAMDAEGNAHVVYGTAAGTISAAQGPAGWTKSPVFGIRCGELNLIIDNNGTPCLAGVTRINGRDNLLVFEQSGIEWSSYLTRQIALNPDDMSMAISSDGHKYFVRKCGDYQMMLTRQTGAGWTDELITTSLGYTSMVIDSSDKLQICYVNTAGHLSYTYAYVPEPASILVLLTGLGGLAYLRRRR